MLLAVHALKDLLGTVKLMALLAVAYGMLTRVLPPLVAQASLGSLVGGAAALAMLDLVPVAQGVILDLRNVPVVLAGAFLGWPGALVATSMAVVTRVWVGGVGLLGGVVGIATACSIGMRWAAWSGHRRGMDWARLAMLAAVSSLYVLSSFLVPWDIALQMVDTVWPFLVPFQVLGVFRRGRSAQTRALHAAGAQAAG